MKLVGGHLPAEHFESRYRHQRDPWGYEHRWYEQRKYSLTLAALTRPRYRSAFEPGCSIGVLSAELAARCERLLCVDYSQLALAEAARRLARLPGVRVERRTLPEEWPKERFDLVVLGEIAYYLDHAGIDQMLEQALETLETGGELVAVDVCQRPEDAPSSGEYVHQRLRSERRLELVGSWSEHDFVVDVLRRRPALEDLGTEAPKQV